MILKNVKRHPFYNSVGEYLAYTQECINEFIEFIFRLVLAKSFIPLCRFPILLQKVEAVTISSFVSHEVKQRDC